MYLTHTNNRTHEALRRGFRESPLFTGRITGIGPRYCPSIEDKINRFAERERHQIFLEPEGYESDVVYVNGFSSSLPAAVQEEALRTIPGLAECVMVRPGYAVEYDYFPPHQVKHYSGNEVGKGICILPDRSMARAAMKKLRHKGSLPGSMLHCRFWGSAFHA